MLLYIESWLISWTVPHLKAATSSVWRQLVGMVTATTYYYSRKCVMNCHDSWKSSKENNCDIGCYYISTNVSLFSKVLLIFIRMKEAPLLLPLRLCKPHHSDLTWALMNYLTLNICPFSVNSYVVACRVVAHRRRVNNRFHYLFIWKCTVCQFQQTSSCVHYVYSNQKWENCEFISSVLKLNVQYLQQTVLVVCDWPSLC